MLPYKFIPFIFKFPSEIILLISFYSGYSYCKGCKIQITDCIYCHICNIKKTYNTYLILHVFSLAEQYTLQYTKNVNLYYLENSIYYYIKQLLGLNISLKMLGTGNDIIHLICFKLSCNIYLTDPKYNSVNFLLNKKTNINQELYSIWPILTNNNLNEILSHFNNLLGLFNIKNCYTKNLKFNKSEEILDINRNILKYALKYVNID